MTFRKLSFISIIIMICLVWLSGCAYPGLIFPSSFGPTAGSGVPGASTPSIEANTPVVSPFPLETTIPATVAPQVIPTGSSPTQTSPVRVPAQYDLDASFDYEGHTLSVVEKITYENLAPVNLPDLLLIVEPNLVPGGFALLSLTWQGGQVIDPYTLDGNQMRIPLPQPLQPGEKLGLEINYHLEIPELSDYSSPARPFAYGYSDKQTNLVDWYLYVPPYRQDVGWLVHPTWWFGEYQVFDVADFQVSLTLARQVPELVIAASAPAVEDSDRYVYHLEAARTFALSASTNYVLQTTMVGDVTINSYAFTYDKSAGQEVLYSTAAALRLYSQLIVPYPRRSLSIVVADFLDGMEYDGLFFLSHGFYDLYDGTPRGYLTFISAHETAHQWWYALVGNDQAEEPWLDEALCTYMELIFYENVYAEPPHSTESLVDWWWYYRVNFYNPQGWVDSTIYDFSDTRSYRDAVYLDGAKFLDDLRGLIGDQAFFSFLREYAIKNTHSIATTDEFFSILKEHTTQDLDSLIDKYFQSGR